MDKTGSFSSLFRKAFPSLEDLVKFVGDCEQCKVKYHVLRRAKKSGGVRTIYSPSKDLRIIQEEILRIISSWHVDGCQYGFVEGKSCLDNALSHIHKYKTYWRGKFRTVKVVPKWMLKIDIKDAFPSITSQHLKVLFEDIFSPLLNKAFEEMSPRESRRLYRKLVAQFVRLTTYRGKLPQGIPCAPYLFNLILYRNGTVAKIREKCEERARKFHRRKCQVTPFNLSIYADDIIITSLKDRIPNRFIRDITRIIEGSHIFKVNPDKVRRSSQKYKAHLITGIVLEDRWGSGTNHVTLPQKVRKTYRGKLHRATAILLQGRLPTREEDGLSIYQAIGILGRIKDVFGEKRLPSNLRRVTKDFERTWKEFKAEIM